MCTVGLTFGDHILLSVSGQLIKEVIHMIILKKKFVFLHIRLIIKLFTIIYDVLQHDVSNELQLSGLHCLS